MCRNLSQAEVEAGGDSTPTSSGVCTIAGEGVQLFVFETEEDAMAWFEAGRMAFTSTARGANWTIVTRSESLAERIAEALDGES
jgi:hypothetical protein